MSLPHPGLPLSRRIVRAGYARKASLPDLKERLLDAREVETDFSLVAAPVSPRNETSFVVVEEGDRILIAVRLLECNRTLLPYTPVTQDIYQGHIEILFDLRCDDLGFCHYLFHPNGVLETNDFSPYPEARSSKWALPKVAQWKFECQTSAKNRGYMVHWFFAWFHRDEIFRHGDIVGFNVCRKDAVPDEYSCWNFAAGNGIPDAQSLGRLCRGRASVTIPKPVVSRRSRQFSTSILNDVPGMITAAPYSPSVLDSEMKTLRAWGVDRIDWIDNSNSPAFWARPQWKENYQKTVASCSDFIAEAGRAAHRHGLQFISDIKLFDLASFDFAGAPSTLGVATHWDGGKIALRPEMEGKEAAFMQSNPAWRKEAQFPIRRLRFYSRTEIPTVKAADLSISVSSDNRHYKLLKRGSYSARVTRVRRRHLRWAPDGCHEEKGHFQNWMLEIDGLDCRVPFLQIESNKPGLEFVNPAFLFAEAQDDSGNAPPIELSRKLAKAGPSRFSYALGWSGWNNHNEVIVNPVKWSLSCLGLAFIDPPSLPGMLEPAHPDARRIWVDRFEALLDRGVDAVSFRLLCHHNGASSWLKYAFAPTVREEFAKRHGRQPEAVEDDFLKIRKIRGDAITTLLREVRKRCQARKRKLVFQVETGSELPAEIGTRMQIHFDYEGWLREGLIDELHVRGLTGHSPWLRDYLLPLAKKHGVKVHLVSRNLKNGLENQAVPVFERIAEDAIEMGYDGFTFYEAVGLYEMNSQGVVVAKGSSQPSIEAVTHRARSKSSSPSSQKLIHSNSTNAKTKKTGSLPG